MAEAVSDHEAYQDYKKSKSPSLFERLKNRFSGQKAAEVQTEPPLIQTPLEKEEAGGFPMSRFPQWLNAVAAKKDTQDFLNQIEKENEKKSGWLSRFRRKQIQKTKQSWQDVVRTSTDAANNYNNAQEEANLGSPTVKSEAKVVLDVGKTMVNELRTGAHVAALGAATVGEFGVNAVKDLKQSVDQDLNPLAPAPEPTPNFLPPVAMPFDGNKLELTEEQKEANQYTRQYNHERRELEQMKFDVDRMRVKLKPEELAKKREEFEEKKKKFLETRDTVRIMVSRIKATTPAKTT